VCALGGQSAGAGRGGVAKRLGWGRKYVTQGDEPAGGRVGQPAAVQGVLALVDATGERAMSVPDGQEGKAAGGEGTATPLSPLRRLTSPYSPPCASSRRLPCARCAGALACVPPIGSSPTEA